LIYLGFFLLKMLGTLFLWGLWAGGNQLAQCGLQMLKIHHFAQSAIVIDLEPHSPQRMV
jgi:hypothetical protein